MAGDITALNRVRWAGLDFDTISDDLRAQLQVKFAASFNDFSVSSLGIVLLDIVAYGLDTLSFYIDRRATDMYLATARTRRSVALLTRQLGYKMSGAVAASTDLQVTTKTAYAFPIPIPKGFQWQGPSGVIFESAQAATIPAAIGNAIPAPVTIPVYQGVTLSETFVSDGSENQIFTLSRVPTDAAVVQGTVQVEVDSTPFEESDFITFDATNQFELNYNTDPPTLRFGDGKAGNIPKRAATIVVTYVATLGTSGQVLSGAIKKEVSPLVVMFTQIGLSVTNPDNSIGGDDLEDLDHAKTYAPRVFKSRRVAITRQDYEALAGSYVDPLFGRVAVAQAISARSAASDLELQNSLAGITASVETATTTTATAYSDALAQTTAVASAIAALQLVVASSVSSLTALTANLSSIVDTSRTLKSSAAEQQENCTDAQIEVTSGKADATGLTALIAAIPSAATSQLSTSDRTAINAYLASITTHLNKIVSLVQPISTLALTQSAGAETQSAVALASQSSVDTMSSSLSDSAQGMLDTATTAVGSTSPASGLYGDLSTIGSAYLTTLDEVTAFTDAIYAHVDSYLSADCKANLVVVPILARDAAGFYAKPSISLIKSLQAYLAGIKEVTHTVAVTSGENFLIPAAIRIVIGIYPGIAESTTRASAVSIVDGVLRDRSFGQSLYISDLSDPLKGITGRAYVNVEILGHRPVGSASILTTKLDTEGNLIVPDSEVITLSSADLVVEVKLFTGN